MGEQGPATHTPSPTFHACRCAPSEPHQGTACFLHHRCARISLAYILCARATRLRQVGPYNNPQETYNYYYLPFCQPSGKGEKPAHKWGGLGEVLQGNELIDSQLDLKFRSAPCPGSLAWPACSTGAALGHGGSRGPVNLQHGQASAVPASPPMRSCDKNGATPSGAAGLSIICSSTATVLEGCRLPHVIPTASSAELQACRRHDWSHALLFSLMTPCLAPQRRSRSGRSAR